MHAPWTRPRGPLGCLERRPRFLYRKGRQLARWGGVCGVASSGWKNAPPEAPLPASALWRVSTARRDAVRVPPTRQLARFSIQKNVIYATHVGREGRRAHAARQPPLKRTCKEIVRVVRTCTRKLCVKREQSIPEATTLVFFWCSRPRKIPSQC